MTLSVSILATGSELLDGRVVDTNSNFVARELAERGLRLKRVLVVDDDLTELVNGLKELSAVSSFIITSGGLGPTGDDLTRDAVAAFCGVDLREFPEARKHLEDFYAQRNRRVDPSNIKQAFLPVGSTMIPNPVGTAPGFVARGASGVIICGLSGVPTEFKRMFSDTVRPLLESLGVTQKPIERRAMKIFGYPESRIGSLVQGCGLDSAITVSYRAAFPEVHVVLKSESGRVDLDTAAKLVEQAVRADTIYTRSLEERLEEVVQRELLAKGATVAVAESCTGGLLGELLTRTPGASAVFQGGVIAYSNDVKRDLLGVPSEVLESAGAVSRECVELLAASVRKTCRTTYGVAISGVAGPDGGTPDKPVGTFHVACASLTKTVAVTCMYVSDRQRIRTYAAYVALDLVRRLVTGAPIPASYPFD